MKWISSSSQAGHVMSLWLFAGASILGTLGCSAGGVAPVEGGSASVAQAITDPVGDCNMDPRVNSGLVPLSVCAGAHVFFQESFGGNGRTCGSCHPAANNYTIDGPFVASLPASDPLFVSENPAFNLSSLETGNIHLPSALIKENVDGFEDVQHKFVERAVAHTLSLATSITRDPTDGTDPAVQDRTGWGGDGAPGDGSLRSFLEGAIKQHYPRDPGRTPGVSFRLPTEAEKDEVLAFQLALGRVQDLDLTRVTITDTQADAGKSAFLDPFAGRCNECHSNAGANARVGAKNRNFNTGTVRIPAEFIGSFPDGRPQFDGGFGGQGLASPNFAAVLSTPDSFGNGTFSPPPLIEAADTGPFFHVHAFGGNEPTQGLENAVAFYASDFFAQSPAAQELDARFGAPLNVGPHIFEIARFLRVLNASFNLAIANQRMNASHLLNVQYWGYRDDIQRGLLGLASKEIDDAQRVLLNGSAGGAALHPNEQASLATAKSLLAQAVATPDPAIRLARTESALTIVQSAKAAFGTNMSFNLGTGNLMF